MINQNTICRYCIDREDSVFNVLDEETKEDLAENMISTHYKKGEILYKEGDVPTGLICLADGKVKVFKEGVGAREQIIRMAKPIGFVGYRALFANDYYSSSAVAIEDSIACLIEKKKIFDLLQKNSELSLRIIRYMAVELGFANTRTVTLTQKHIRGRLAESLIFLKDTYGFAEDKATIKVYLSREDLANLSNMTTSNAIRTLSTFASEGVIAINARKIKILDIKTLENISNLG